MIIGLILVFLSVIFLIILYLVKPNKKRTEGLPVQQFAHRGLHGNGVPENSIAAFKRAYDRKLGVELDVRFTRDKKIVVFHDDSLKRLCRQDINVNELTYEELQNYKLAGTDEKIPLFSEVLKVLDGMPVICEIKSSHKEPTDELCAAVCDEIAQYKGFICIESFDPFVVKWFKENRPDLVRGQLSMNFFRDRDNNLSFMEKLAMTNLFVNVLSRPDFIAYRYRDDSFGYFLCRRLFKPLCVPWTVRGESEIKEASVVYSSIIFEEQ